MVSSGTASIVAAQRGSELDVDERAFKRCRAAVEGRESLVQQLDATGAALDDPGGAQRAAQRHRSAERSRAFELRREQHACLIAAPESVQCQGGVRAPMMGSGGRLAAAVALQLADAQEILQALRRAPSGQVKIRTGGERQAREPVP